MQDLELKLKLAKELPELIHITYNISTHTYVDGSTDICFSWLDTAKEVTDREWDWVVNHLLQQTKWELIIDDKTNWIRATWQQRAEAYFRTIGKEI